MRRALTALVALSLLLVLTGCEDRRSPVDKAVGWFPASQQAMARCVIHHESNGRPDAVSPTNDHGIFQINAVHRRAVPDLSGKAFPPGASAPTRNGQHAQVPWEQNAWRAWSGARRC